MPWDIQYLRWSSIKMTLLIPFLEALPFKMGIQQFFMAFKNSNNKRLKWIFLKRVSMFGNDPWLKWFLQTYSDEKILYEKLETILENVIKSDNPKACEIIHSKFEDDLKNKKFQQMALTRGKMGVINALKINSSETLNVDDVYQRAPKSEEFDYFDNIAKLKKLLSKRGRRDIVWLSMKELLDELIVPGIHYGEKYENGCPEKCNHKRTCLRIRQTEKLVKDMAKVAAEKHPIFADPELIVVGSMKEQTKESL